MVNPEVGKCYKTVEGVYMGSCQRVYAETVYEEFGHTSKKNTAEFIDNYKRKESIDETEFKNLKGPITCLPLEHYLSELTEFQKYGLSPTNGLDSNKKYYYQKHLWKVKAQKRTTGGTFYLLEREGTTGEGPGNRLEVYYGNDGDVSVYKSLVSEDIVKQHEALVMHIVSLIDKASKEANTLLTRNNGQIKEIESNKGTFNMLFGKSAEDIAQLKEYNQSIIRVRDTRLTELQEELRKVNEHYPLRFQTEESPSTGSAAASASSGGNSSSSSLAVAAQPMKNVFLRAGSTVDPAKFATFSAPAASSAPVPQKTVTVTEPPVEAVNSSAAVSSLASSGLSRLSSVLEEKKEPLKPTGSINDPSLEGGRRRKSRKSKKSRKARKGKKGSRRRV